MKTIISFIVFALIMCISVQAQQQDTSKSPNQDIFDFWIGDWDLSWESANGTQGHGTNKIERVLKAKVIKENFEATDGSLTGYVGKSWSVYNTRTNEWNQTWVDNQGGYLDFTGGKDGDKRFFEREAIRPNGKPIKQRMVFYNIKEDSFTWDWEQSVDDGKNWTLQWRIQYQRSN